MTIEAQIEELRAELGSCSDGDEIAAIRREMAAALEEKIARDQALETMLLAAI
jgi:hypothetical protein